MTMHSSRRDFLLSGAALGGAALLPALPSQAQASVGITVMHPFTNNAAVADALQAEFAAAEPDIALTYIVGGDNWDPLLQTILRNALVGNLPDAAHEALSYARLLARRGISQPLDGIVGDAAALEKAGIPKPLIDSVTAENGIHAIPFGTTIPVIYYNRDLMARAGHEGPLPETWDDIIAVARDVAALGGDVNGGYMEYAATNAWMFQNLLTSFGGRMMTPDGSDIAFDGPEGLQAMEILYRFGEANNVDMTNDQARQAFNSGVTGVHVRSASGLTSITKAAQGNFTLDVGQQPVPGPNGILVGAGHGVMMFTTDPAKQEAVRRYMNFVSGPKGQAILFGNSGYMPINTIVAGDPATMESYYAANPWNHMLVERLPIIGDYYAFPTDNTVQIFDVMIEYNRLTVARQMQPAEALAGMATDVRALLKA
jgi:multiple sugar transport system substrate-binding protein